LQSYINLNKTEEERANELHFSSIVIDCSTIVNFHGETLSKVKKGGITASNHTVTRPTSNFAKGAAELSECLGWIWKNSNEAILIERAHDIELAKESKKFGIILGPQNSDIIDGDISMLPAIFKMGVRIMQLTYQTRNYVGDGCGEKNDCGISAFGFNLISEMNDLGIVVDLSHCGWRTTIDGIAASTKPPIVSHSHPYALAPHPRCKTDEQIHALAEKGGVIGITEYSPICEGKSGVRPTINDYLDHIEYVVKLVGVDHVGIGLDIDERSTPQSFAEFKRDFPELCGNYVFETRRVAGLTELTDCPQITKGLVSRGYSDQEIQKILGLNFLRVFKENWK
jgi:membrane dipeptidase